jgi:hypothetical protein
MVRWGNIICRSADQAISSLFHMWLAYCLLYKNPRCIVKYAEAFNFRQIFMVARCLHPVSEIGNSGCKPHYLDTG